MDKVKFCIEEDNPYSLERLEKVLGKFFWYANKRVRKALQELIEFHDIESLEQLLKVIPHAPVYDREKLKEFKPNVLLITNEPGLNITVLRNLYLKPLRTILKGLCGKSGCVYGSRLVLEELIERFNRSMRSWLTFTPLSELGNKVNGDMALDCKSIDLAGHFKKISYWIPNVDKEGQIKIDFDDIDIDKLDDINNNCKETVKCWLKFCEDEIKAIHWDLLPYAQYNDEKNYINEEIVDIIKEVKSKSFQEICNAIELGASYSQALWYTKLLRKFLDTLKEIEIIEKNFFILVVGNRIIETKEKKEKRETKEKKDRKEALGHLFAGLYEANKEIEKAVVIFRDKWCSCDSKGNLFFIKFNEFIENGKFDWRRFDTTIKKMSNNQSQYYGGKNIIPCKSLRSPLPQTRRGFGTSPGGSLG